MCFVHSKEEPMAGIDWIDVEQKYGVKISI